MRPACIAALVFLAVTSSTFAKSTTTILPQATGSITHFPAPLNMTFVQGVDLQSMCFMHSETILERRRAFMEFSIPAFDKKGVTTATLIITDLSTTTKFPPPPPVVHEVSFYAADLVIDVADYDTPTTLVGTLETDEGEGAEVHEIAFDVTEIVRQFEEGNVGFRIKLQIDPAGPCSRPEGADFGSLFVHPPRLVIKGK